MSLQWTKVTFDARNKSFISWIHFCFVMSSPVINMSSVAPKYFKMHKQAKYKLKNSGCCCNPKLQLKLTPLNSTLSQAKGKKTFIFTCTTFLHRWQYIESRTTKTKYRENFVSFSVTNRLASSSLRFASISLLGGYWGRLDGSHAWGSVVKNCMQSENKGCLFLKRIIHDNNTVG